MDIDKQFIYWRSSAEEELEVAFDLYEKKRFRQALFFAHLAIEKMLKAFVTRSIHSVPPKTQNLIRLIELASLKCTVEMHNSATGFFVKIQCVSDRYALS